MLAIIGASFLDPATFMVVISNRLHRAHMVFMMTIDRMSLVGVFVGSLLLLQAFGGSPLDRSGSLDKAAMICASLRILGSIVMTVVEAAVAVIGMLLLGLGLVVVAVIGLAF